MARKQTKSVEYKEPQTAEGWLGHASRHIRYCPEPTRSFRVGERVAWGAHSNVIVERTLLDGKAYVVEYDLTDREGNVTGRGKGAAFWYEVFPPTAEKSGFYHQALRLQFLSQDVAAIIHRVLWNGMDLQPVYQRGLVWGPADREKLLDSVFAGRNLGTFVVRNLPYTSESLGAGKPIEELVDGVQRTTALLDYYLGKYQYRGKYFHELDARDRHEFMACRVTVGELGQRTTDEEALRAFLLLNDTGKPVAKEHLEKVRAMLGVK